MTNITIIGSGFGALTAVRELRRRKVAADITLISPRDSRNSASGRKSICNSTRCDATP